MFRLTIAELRAGQVRSATPEGNTDPFADSADARYRKGSGRTLLRCLQEQGKFGCSTAPVTILDASPACVFPGGGT